MDPKPVRTLCHGQYQARILLALSILLLLVGVLDMANVGFFVSNTILEVLEIDWELPGGDCRPLTPERSGHQQTKGGLFNGDTLPAEGFPTRPLSRFHPATTTKRVSGTGYFIGKRCIPMEKSRLKQTALFVFSIGTLAVGALGIANVSFFVSNNGLGLLQIAVGVCGLLVAVR